MKMRLKMMIIHENLRKIDFTEIIKLVHSLYSLAANERYRIGISNRISGCVTGKAGKT